MFLFMNRVFTNSVMIKARQEWWAASKEQERTVCCLIIRRINFGISHTHNNTVILHMKGKIIKCFIFSVFRLNTE